MKNNNVKKIIALALAISINMGVTAKDNETKSKINTSINRVSVSNSCSFVKREIKEPDKVDTNIVYSRNYMVPDNENFKSMASDIEYYRTLKNLIIEESMRKYNMNGIYGNSLYSDDRAIKYILDKYNLTMHEFAAIVSVVYHEAAANNYDDAYRVINTIYNRIISKLWTSYVSRITGHDGYNLFVQVTAPNQFVTYHKNSSGYDYDKLIGTKAYEATIDMLVSEVRIHDFLGFKASGVKVKGGIQYTKGGNVYHALMAEDDFIDDGYTLVKKK